MLYLNFEIMKKISGFLGIVAFVFAISGAVASQSIMNEDVQAYEYVAATDKDPAQCTFKKNCEAGSVACKVSTDGATLRKGTDVQTQCGEELTQRPE